MVTETSWPIDIDAWLTDPQPVRARPTDLELAAELIGSTLRHADGIDRHLVRARTGFDPRLPAIVERQALATMTASTLPYLR